MEISSALELPNELVREDPNLFNQTWHVNSLDQHGLLPLAAAFGENLQQSFFIYNDFPPALNLKTSIGSTSHSAAIERPVKQIKTNAWINPCNIDHTALSNLQAAAFSPNNFSFLGSNYVNPEEEVAGSEIMEPFASQNSFGRKNVLLKACHGNKRVSTGNQISHTPDHIIAERKRREKLSQKFIALSAMIPGLKKMDKASVLGDAIKYLKQLQEKVKTLEEQTRKKTVESAVSGKKSRMVVESDDFPLNGNFSGPFDEPLPEIEARFCDKSVLIRIHCEKRKGVAEKIMFEIEKCHLTVINSNVITFGISALDITILAQMEMEFYMTVKDLVKRLSSAFRVSI